MDLIVKISMKVDELDNQLKPVEDIVGLQSASIGQKFKSKKLYKRAISYT